MIWAGEEKLGRGEGNPLLTAANLHFGNGSNKRDGLCPAEDQEGKILKREKGGVKLVQGDPTEKCVPRRTFNGNRTVDTKYRER